MFICVYKNAVTNVNLSSVIITRKIITITKKVFNKKKKKTAFEYIAAG